MAPRGMSRASHARRLLSCVVRAVSGTRPQQRIRRVHLRSSADVLVCTDACSIHPVRLVPQGDLRHRRSMPPSRRRRRAFVASTRPIERVQRLRLARAAGRPATGGGRCLRWIASTGRELREPRLAKV